MTTTVFLAVIGAAILHALWNAMVKNGKDKFVSMTAVILGQGPLAILALQFVPSPAPESFPFIIAGIALHVGYQIFLPLAYRIGDLSQVYPIARGTAPLLVAAISVIFLGVELNTLETVGIMTIGAGIISLALVRKQDGQRNTNAAVLALITSGFIAGYSIVDGTGARLAGSAIGFYAWLALGNILIYVPIMLLWRPSVVRQVLSTEIGRGLGSGTASFVAFAIVIWAFTQAPIALVTALRETSIVFALLIGVFFMNEKLDLAKVASTMTTLLGAALLRFSRIT